MIDAILVILRAVGAARSRARAFQFYTCQLAQYVHEKQLVGAITWTEFDIMHTAPAASIALYVCFSAILIRTSTILTA